MIRGSQARVVVRCFSFLLFLFLFVYVIVFPFLLFLFIFCMIFMFCFPFLLFVVFLAGGFVLLLHFLCSFLYEYMCVFSICFCFFNFSSFLFCCYFFISIADANPATALTTSQLPLVVILSGIKIPVVASGGRVW